VKCCPSFGHCRISSKKMACASSGQYMSHTVPCNNLYMHLAVLAFTCIAASQLTFTIPEGGACHATSGVVDIWTKSLSSVSLLCLKSSMEDWAFRRTYLRWVTSLPWTTEFMWNQILRAKPAKSSISSMS
jgi:hypothetical protein